MNMGNALILAASALALVVILVNELKLRRTDPKSEFTTVLNQISERDEADVAKALDRLYEINEPTNRDAHKYLEIAQTYLEKGSGENTRPMEKESN